MTRDEILAAFDRIRVWQQGDRRAVHKPLLVLFALGRLLRGEAPLVEFAGIEDKLGKLLEEFGPSGSEKTRHNPFWDLRTDGVWQLAGPDVVQNGFALCSLHHKIFDLGAFTVLPGNHQIVFSRHLMGGGDTRAKLLAHHGAGLIQPQGRECLPQPEFLAWHRAEVFKEPARE
jgi:predicted restriction endonuclease